MTPSRWLADCAQSSPLLHDKTIEVIPNGIDLQSYRLLDKSQARRELELAPDKYYVLFGSPEAASDSNPGRVIWKGFDLFVEAMQMLVQQRVSDPIELLIMGADEPAHPPDFGLPARYLGFLRGEEALNRAYAAADVFVLPSRQDNLPNMIMEALASGTPCAAFAIGGNVDMIVHQQNGYLAEPYNVADLAEGVRWIIEHPHPDTLREAARETVERQFRLEDIAQRYADLYARVVRSH